MREADTERPFLTPDSPTGSPIDDAESRSAGLLVRARWLRVVLLAAGFVSIALGVLGIVLPLLPTTPFLLLAGFCFARGSKRTHAWLLRHRVFGRIVRQWQENRTIPERAKWTAIVLVFAAFTLSAVIVPNCAYGYVTLLIVGSALVVFLAKLPTTARSETAHD